MVARLSRSAQARSLREQSWEDFTRPWDQDVKACLHWLQATTRLPLAPGARVLIGSSESVDGAPPVLAHVEKRPLRSSIFVSYSHRDIDHLAQPCF